MLVLSETVLVLVLVLVIESRQPAHLGNESPSELQTGAKDALQSVAGTFGQGLPIQLLTRPLPLPYSLSRRHADRWSRVEGSFRTPSLRNVGNRTAGTYGL